MKIRTVIMLVAGGTLALPDIARAQDVAPRLEVTSYSRTLNVQGAEYCLEGLAPVEYHDEVSYTPTLISRTGHDLRACEWYISGGWTETWPGPGLPGEADYWTEGQPPMSDVTIEPFSQEIPRAYHVGCTTRYWDGGWEGYHTEEICESATVRYLTGRGTPSKTRLHRLGYYVRDRETGVLVPYSQITALGKSLDQYGAVFKALPDDTSVDATPTVTGHSAWEFDIAHEPITLEIRDQLTGQYITDKTNVVWVGEKMDLSCVLPSGIGTTITNYLWRVDGRKIKDWVVSGTGTNATTADVLFWGYDSNRTAATTQFIWTEPSSNLTVACTVQVGGETLVAQTKFEVRRPEANWTLTAKYGKVVVTNTQCYVPLPGYYRLTTGIDCELNETNWNDVGMQFNYQITDLKGYTNSYDVSFVQLAYIDWKWNMTPPPVGPTTYKSMAKNTRGLDQILPYKNWGQSLSGSAWDTPTVALLERYSFHWRFDEFQAYLMWQPTRRPSIPVPLKVASWNWYGKTERIDTNSPPTWRLLSSTKPVSTVGTECYAHPTWTNIIHKVSLTFSNDYYPTP